MRKSVVDALFTGVFKRSINAIRVKTGIFAASAVSRSRINKHHKKIAPRRLLVAHSCSLQARLTDCATGEAREVNAAIGVLPFFVQSQKRGAKSCSK
jgi:hypothetical protein